MALFQYKRTNMKLSGKAKRADAVEGAIPTDSNEDSIK